MGMLPKCFLIIRCRASCEAIDKKDYSNVMDAMLPPVACELPVQTEPKRNWGELQVLPARAGGLLQMCRRVGSVG